nr:putative magnetosome protein Mad10 [Candidatus Magnetobacterium casensis]
MGDYMADLIDKVSDAAKASAKGIVLTYDIRDLRGRKKDVLHKLGKRLTECRNIDGGAFVARDDELTRLLDEFDDIQNKAETFLKERTERLYPQEATSCVHSAAELKDAVDITPVAEEAVSKPVEAVAEEIVSSEPVETVVEEAVSEPVETAAEEVASEYVEPAPEETVKNEDVNNISIISPLPVVASEGSEASVEDVGSEDQPQDEKTQNEGV